MKKNSSLKFRRYTEDKQFGFGNSVYERISTDDFFVSLKPRYNILKAKLSEWNIARAEAQDGGKIHTLVKKEKQQATMDCLVDIAKRVDLLAENNESIILAAGFDVNKTPSRITQLDTPVILGVQQGNQEGEIVARWKKVKGALNYAIEYRTIGSENWKNGTYSSKVRQELPGFVPGTKVQVRIRALGRNNLKSNWSEPVAGWSI